MYALTITYTKPAGQEWPEFFTQEERMYVEMTFGSGANASFMANTTLLCTDDSITHTRNSPDITVLQTLESLFKDPSSNLYTRHEWCTNNSSISYDISEVPDTIPE